MYNILDFIDSKSIQNFNKDTQFSPAEQAILIAESERRTIEEKLNAWKEILHAYSEEEFQYENFAHQAINFKDIIINTIKSWEEALLRRKSEAHRYVYAAYLNEKEFNDEMLQTATFSGHQGHIIRPDRDIPGH